jgi:hypothetical protein
MIPIWMQMTLMELLGMDRQQREARREIEALRTETRAAQVAAGWMSRFLGLRAACGVRVGSGAKGTTYGKRDADNALVRAAASRCIHFTGERMLGDHLSILFRGRRQHVLRDVARAGQGQPSI